MVTSTGRPAWVAGAQPLVMVGARPGAYADFGGTPPASTRCTRRHDVLPSWQSSDSGFMPRTPVYRLDGFPVVGISADLSASEKLVRSFPWPFLAGWNSYHCAGSVA